MTWASYNATTMTVQILRLGARLFSSAAMVLSVCSAAAEAALPGADRNCPNRPIRIVTANVGGGSDFAARLIA